MDRESVIVLVIVLVIKLVTVLAMKIIIQYSIKYFNYFDVILFIKIAKVKHYMEINNFDYNPKINHIM